MATSPWTYMARKDQGLGSFFGAFMAQVAYVVMMLALAIFSLPLSAAMEVFAVVMAFGVVIHMRMMVDVYRAETFSLELAA